MGYYPYKFCFTGFGSPKSIWNHHQRCLSNPEVLYEIKKMKKADDDVKKELKNAEKKKVEGEET